MKISCPACAAKYSIADEKVQDKLAKIRCRKCGTTIVIDGKVSPPNVYAGEGGASNVEQPAVSDPSAAGIAVGEYSVDFGDNDQRTMTLADIVAAYNSGQVTAETFVWTEGMADWAPVSDVPTIIDALHAASAPAPSPQMPAAAPHVAATPAPWQAPVAPKVEPAHHRAAVSGGRAGSTSDLFGASFEHAGSEQDVTTSAREPAGVGGGGGASATGARNESSVLFSLSALTSAAKPATAPSATSALSMSSSTGASTATKEDSGLIDLKALTASADQNQAAAAPIAPLAPSPLGVAPPLGLAPPMGMGGYGGVEAQITPPQQKSKAGIYIGAGIAVAAVAIAAAIIVTNKQPPPPAPTVAAPTPPPPAPPPATTTEDPVTAKPPATGAGEEEKTKTAATGGKRPSGGTRPVSGGKAPASGGDKPAAASGGDKPKPAAAKSPCGCAPSDLQCAMKCAAGG